jgi:hypothetical protein
MNKQPFKQPMIAVGLLTLAGAVGAQTLYTHELARRVASNDSHAGATFVPAPAAGKWDPWTALHTDMVRMQAQMDRMFDNAFQNGHAMPDNAFQPGGSKITVEKQDGNYQVKANVPGA